MKILAKDLSGHLKLGPAQLFGHHNLHHVVTANHVSLDFAQWVLLKLLLDNLAYFLITLNLSHISIKSPQKVFGKGRHNLEGLYVTFKWINWICEC